MSRQTDLPQDVKQQNGKKVFLQKITTSGTATATALAATDAEGVSVEAGATLVLQCDQDFYYQLIPTASATSLTLPAGARPGIKILAGQQEFVTSAVADGKIDALQVTASGTLLIFVCK